MDAATLQTKVSPVQKVIELLDDLAGKVKGDLAKEETLMEEYTKWCDSEANEKEDAITSATRTISELEATIEESSVTIDLFVLSWIFLRLALGHTKERSSQVNEMLSLFLLRSSFTRLSSRSSRCL